MVDTKPGASYVMDSTGQHDLTIPSGAETGLKLIQGFTAPAGVVASFTVDFVLSKSLIAPQGLSPDRKSTRLNSSHDQISYAVFCLKKKKATKANTGNIKNLTASDSRSCTSAE